MSNVERFSAFCGAVLIGIAAILVSTERNRMARNDRRPSPLVEDLGKQLKQAWADRHNA